MKRRQPPSDTAGIPPELYHGIASNAFPWFGNDPVRAARSSESLYRRRLWVTEARRHGYTVLSLREAAETDPRYLAWLAGANAGNAWSARAQAEARGEGG